MINRRDALWGVMGVVSLILVLVIALQLLMERPSPWAGLLAVVILGSVAGGVPTLPRSILLRYRVLWLLQLGACGVLGFWPGARMLRALGLAMAGSIAAIGHFWCKWRVQNTPIESETASEDSKNDKP